MFGNKHRLLFTRLTGVTSVWFSSDDERDSQSMDTRWTPAVGGNCLVSESNHIDRLSEHVVTVQVRMRSITARMQGAGVSPLRALPVPNFWRKCGHHGAAFRPLYCTAPYSILYLKQLDHCWVSSTIQYRVHLSPVLAQDFAIVAGDCDPVKSAFVMTRIKYYAALQRRSH